MSQRVRVNKKIRGYRVDERKWDNANRSVYLTNTYTVALGDEEVAYIKSSYWTSGVDDAYHQYEVAAEVAGKVVFMRKSHGFGHRTRRDATSRRTEHLAAAFDRVRAVLLEEKKDDAA